MDDFCSSYAKEESWRRNYCFKISSQNKEIAPELSSEIFKYVCEAEVKFNITEYKILNEDEVCLDFTDPKDISSTNCSNFNLNQDWEIFKDKSLTNNNFYKDKDGNCLTGVLENSKMVTVECDFCDENQIFNSEATGFDSFIKNLGTGEYLNLDIPNFSSEAQIINFSISDPS